MMTLLVRHPDTPAGAIHSVDAALVRTPGGLAATFRLIGDLEQLVLPAAMPAGRADELWKTTCCELFVAGEGKQYREYNFSPSTRWAAYDFTSYRNRRGDCPVQVEVECFSDYRTFTLVAKIACETPRPARIGLSAVVEEADGAIRYWAVEFAPGKPDFHAEASRALLLDGVDAR